MEATGKAKKGAVGRKASSPRKKVVTCFVKAGLQFTVGRIGQYLKNGYAKHVGTGAPVYLPAVLEYLTAEASVGVTISHGKLGRTPLGKLLAGVTISHGGVLPNINPVLLLKKTTAAKELKSPVKATKSPKKTVAAKA